MIMDGKVPLRKGDLGPLHRWCHLLLERLLGASSCFGCSLLVAFCPQWPPHHGHSGHTALVGSLPTFSLGCCPLQCPSAHGMPLLGLYMLKTFAGHCCLFCAQRPHTPAWHYYARHCQPVSCHPMQALVISCRGCFCLRSRGSSCAPTAVAGALQLPSCLCSPDTRLSCTVGIQEFAGAE